MLDPSLSRMKRASRVIANSVPNVTNGFSSAWQDYVTSSQEIEHDTGLTFFTALNSNLAGVLRMKIDCVTPPAMPPPGFQSISVAGGQISLVLTGAVAKYTISSTTNQLLKDPRIDHGPICSVR